MLSNELSIYIMCNIKLQKYVQAGTIPPEMPSPRYSRSQREYPQQTLAGCAPQPIHRSINQSANKWASSLDLKPFTSAARTTCSGRSFHSTTVLGKNENLQQAVLAPKREVIYGSFFLVFLKNSQNFRNLSLVILTNWNLIKRNMYYKFSKEKNNNIYENLIADKSNFLELRKN